jgi:nuclear pore complex protein Nup133
VPKITLLYHIFVSDGNLAILISYSGKEVSDDFRRLYALAELRSSVDGSFSIIRLESVPYQTVS